MHSPSTAHSGTPRRLRKWFTIATLLLTPFLIGALWIWNNHRLAEQALADAIAETHRLDPKWRIEDLEEELRQIPEKENAGIPIAEALRHYRASVPPRTFVAPIAIPAPQFRFSRADSTKAREFAKIMAPVAEKARLALPMKTGTFAAGRPGKELRDDAGDAFFELKCLADNLAIFAASQCEDGNNGDAWQTALVLLAAARSIGGPREVWAQRGRARIDSTAAAVMERCLAHGKISDDLLALAQAELAREAAQPLMSFAIRTERAVAHQVFLRWSSGEISIGYLWKEMQDYQRGSMRSYLLNGFSCDAEHAEMLMRLNKLFVISRLPLERWIGELTKLEPQESDEDEGVHSTPWLIGFFKNHLKFMTSLQLAKTGLSIERFRLQFGRWPETLQEAVDAKLLDSIFVDPYDGKPVRYRRTKDGVVVYSISESGNYRGDALENPTASWMKVRPPEFRLWDENKRGQMTQEPVFDSKI